MQEINEVSSRQEQTTSRVSSPIKINNASQELDTKQRIQSHTRKNTKGSTKKTHKQLSSASSTKRVQFTPVELMAQVQNEMKEENAQVENPIEPRETKSEG